MIKNAKESHLRKTKGEKLQKEIVADLIEIFPQHAENIKSNPISARGEDVLMTDEARKDIPFSFEVKYMEKGLSNVYSAYGQCQRQTVNIPATNVFTYKDFYFDWQKQKKLIYYLKRNDLVLDADLIVFDDRANSLNAINRTIRFYEWNGILKYTFGDESRHGLNLDQLYDYSDKKNNKWPHKNQLSRPKGYTLSKNPEAVLIIIRPKNFANYLFGKGPLIEVEASKLSNVVIDL